MTNKELIALTTELASDAAIGIIPIMSLSKSQKEKRNFGSTVGHFAAATGVVLGLDKASDIATKKILGVSGGEVLNEQIFKKVLPKMMKGL